MAGWGQRGRWLSTWSPTHLRWPESQSRRLLIVDAWASSMLLDDDVIHRVLTSQITIRLLASCCRLLPEGHDARLRWGMTATVVIQTDWS